ncbi:hypothetical protein COCNU_16G004370 [Cocos nucifera]|uniref:FAS1 domain-containing protein n=1 Tax=Cocos nucifera TaxID=13894 RepID=A0A8K0NDT2_COCNU|nr:hypothetical protein COCNU_16G004370 [Cocos nucifera]
MAPKPQVVILLLRFLFLSSAMAFNITAILEPFSEFTTFNKYLNQTKLVHEINHRQTITILVVDNSSMSAISSLPEESIKHVMEVHVILDYCDIRKISRILGKSFLLTTLFQTTGVATKRMGKVKVNSLLFRLWLKGYNTIAFGPALQGIPAASHWRQCTSNSNQIHTKMAPKPQVVILLLRFLFLSSAMAFNITAILEPFSEFTTFNKYLNQTKLVHEINHRQTITILVVDNSSMSAISSLPEESIKHVMEVHVILDYCDIRKISRILGKSFLLTTLFQTTGVATKRMGFLNITHKADESVLFGSAVLSVLHTSTLIKKVMTMPYNISVL